MPELPEVETIKNILKSLIIGKVIRDVEILYRGTIEGDLQTFRDDLKGKAFRDIARRGKFIIFHLDGGLVLLSHLRMEGKYFYHDSPSARFGEHAAVVFHFSDGTSLEYNDTRKFGIMKIMRESDYLEQPPLSRLGPEPSDVTSIESLLAKMKHKSIPIKTLLLDQHFLAGLGNIYVDEVLFQTKIHPETPAKLISEKQLKAIVDAGVEVLSRAIADGGSTIRSYHPSQGIDGGFQTKLSAYGREGLPCLKCHHPMRKIFVGGRGTTFCPRCQRNPDRPYVLGITGPIGSGKSLATAFFKDHGYLTLDSDQIVRDLYSDDTIKKLIIATFGQSSYRADGGFNRDFIADVIISDASKKRRLEKILHPRVKEAIAKAIKDASKAQSIAIEVPLLFEAGLDDLCDETLYIDIARKEQMKRLIQRPYPVAKSLALNAGFDAAQDKKIATYVIDNSGSIDDLEAALSKILHQ